MLRISTSNLDLAAKSLTSQTVPQIPATDSNSVKQRHERPGRESKASEVCSPVSEADVYAVLHTLQDTLHGVPLQLLLLVLTVAASLDLHLVVPRLDRLRVLKSRAKSHELHISLAHIAAYVSPAICVHARTCACLLRGVEPSREALGGWSAGRALGRQTLQGMPGRSSDVLDSQSREQTCVPMQAGRVSSLRRVSAGLSHRRRARCLRQRRRGSHGRCRRTRSRGRGRRCLGPHPQQRPSRA